MTRPALVLVLLALSLAACGADGPPLRPPEPAPEQQQGAITITGQGRFGVTASNG